MPKGSSTLRTLNCHVGCANWPEATMLKPSRSYHSTMYVNRGCCVLQINSPTTPIPQSDSYGCHLKWKNQPFFLNPWLLKLGVRDIDYYFRLMNFTAYFCQHWLAQRMRIQMSMLLFSPDPAGLSGKPQRHCFLVCIVAQEPSLFLCAYA